MTVDHEEMNLMAFVLQAVLSGPGPFWIFNAFEIIPLWALHAFATSLIDFEIGACCFPMPS